MNTMEVLVLGHQYGEPTRFWGFVNISASPTKAATKHDLKILNRLLDKVDAEVYEPSYHAPAGDCLAIHIAGNATNLISVLSNPTVQYAARVLNSRLMRKGPVGLFSKYHCYDLADQAIGP